MNIHRIDPRHESHFDGLLRIYEESLAPSERKCPPALRAMVARPEYLFLIAQENERVLGFAIAIAMRETDAALLEYMAVHQEHRGRGIGTALFRAMAAWPEIAGRFLLVEVEADGDDSPDREQRTRRKQFYRRLGCRRLDGLHYLMPPVTPATPPPMYLLVWRDNLPAWIRKDRARAWLEACYAQVYAVPPGDPRIAGMLATCSDAIPLV